MASLSRLRVLACSLALALLLTSMAGCVQDQDGEDLGATSSSPAPEAPTTLVDWQAPNYTGNFAVQLVATPGDPDTDSAATAAQDPLQCTFGWAFAGRNDGTGFGGDIRLTWMDDGDRQHLNTTARVGGQGAHAASTATPTEEAFDIRWALEGEREVPVEAQTVLTVVTTGLAPWDEDGKLHPAASLTAQCDTGVDLQAAATGSHVFAFTSHGLRGGAGASLGLPPDGSPGVQANVADHHEIDIPTPRALVDIREPASDRDPLAKQGQLTLEHPAGTETRSFGPEPIEPITLEGGPGTYELAVDRVAVGSPGFHGYIVGLEPVPLPSTETPGALEPR